MKASEPPVRVKHIFSHPPTLLWRAITDPELMKQWYFETMPDFRPEVNFYSEFEVYSGERRFTHQWKISAVNALQSISYFWKYKEYPGNSRLTMTLTPTAQGTLLEVLHEILEDFPDDIPEFNRESCRNGWEYFISGRLQEFLDRETP